MRVALLIFVLSISLVDVSAQQDPHASTAEEPLPREPISQNSPCANQSRSFSELTESFNKGRAASAAEWKRTWVAIGSFDNAIRPNHRSLNCTGIRRGKKFEFAIVGVDYDEVMEVHAIGYRVQRVKLELNHKGNGRFLVDLDADGAEDLYNCRLTRVGTLVCLDVTTGPGFKRTAATSGEEFKRMNVADSQLFTGLEP